MGPKELPAKKTSSSGLTPSILKKTKVLYGICIFAICCSMYYIIQNWDDTPIPFPITTSSRISATSMTESSTLNLIQKLDSTAIPMEENASLTAAKMADDSLSNFNQSDPRILDYIRKHHLKPPSTEAYNLTPTDNSIESVWSDPVAPVVLNLLNNMTNGFFIECGANDGEFLSNTLYSMELKYGWTGLLIEADPEPLKILPTRNRKAWIANVCLATKPYPHKVEMLRHKEWNGVSHIKGALTGRTNLDYPFQFEAQCFPLFSILSAINVTVVDYLSLDVEGVELSVLKTFPFDGPIRIKVISAEVQPGKSAKLKKFLASKGYRVTNHIAVPYVHDLIFVHESVLDTNEKEGSLHGTQKVNSTRIEEK